MELTSLNLEQTIESLKNKKFSSVELVKSYLSRIYNKQKELNAYITVAEELAIKKAKESDKLIAIGSHRLMEGIPIAVKDSFCTKDIRTTAASRILKNFIPSYESYVTEKLLECGSIIIGKTNMDEFSMGSSSSNSYFGPVVNPWKYLNDPTKTIVPGGSSGGSAVSITADLAIAALGTDTGGSVRQPAAFCGVVGIKPTYGLCSRWGIIAFASSLDQAGFFSKTVRDAAILLQSSVGYDPKDSTSLKINKPNYLKSISGNIQGLKVGIPKEYISKLKEDDILNLLNNSMVHLKKAGAEVFEVNLPMSSYALPVYYILALAEASSNLARYDGIRYGLRIHEKSIDDIYRKTRGYGFGKEVIRRIILGTHVLSSGYYEDYYNRAQKVRNFIIKDFKEAFNQVDVLLTPTTPKQAFPLEDENDQDPLIMYLNDIFTVPVNLAQLPAISVPLGFSNKNMPLGLQLIGPKLSEPILLNAAYVLEQSSNFLYDSKKLRKF